MALLEVTDLQTHFAVEAAPGEDGTVRAVDGISFELNRGEVLCRVGESGSGKSVASLSILGLVPNPPGRIVGGKIMFEGNDLVKAKEAHLRSIRGKRIAMIFQDPMTSLNPYLKIGTQLGEVLEIHEGLGGSEARERMIAMLEKVGIPAPATRLDDYPHQLSGGMRQRAMIAMALLCEPDVLIADEPTTALDVTIQAQILELIRERLQDMGLAVLLITHDLGVVAKMADRVAVMYAGRIVECGDVDMIFSEPKHPYTLALQHSIPRLDGGADRGKLAAIEGLPPSPTALPGGCPFHPRCGFAIDACREVYPAEREFDDGHRVHCHVEEVC